MTHRFATPSDCPLLGELNHQLIEDEGHRNPMSPGELAQRMNAWLDTEYRAVIFENEADLIGYALFRESADEIYLRQLFVSRNMRRRGFGRAMMTLLRGEIWPAEKPLTVEVLLADNSAVQFWRAVGYRDYALTLEILPRSSNAALPHSRSAP